MKKKYQCICKELSHTIDTKELEWRFFKASVDSMGELITIQVLGKGIYLVPRIYIAKHGLKGSHIDKLGFTKIQ